MSISYNSRNGFLSYEGPLAEPLPTPTAFSSDAEWDKWKTTRTEKMHLLMRHYGIDPEDIGAWVKLADALARRYVPGFMPTPRIGRPKERTDDCTLFLLFQLLILRDCVGERTASKVIERTGRFRGNSETLRKRYRLEKNGPMGLLIKIFDGVIRRRDKSVMVAQLEKTVGNLLPQGRAEKDSV
jgi:hypothetical protein